ncbi:MAG: hypothetical protein WBB82_08615 [Limnothrix sp.]
MFVQFTAVLQLTGIFALSIGAYLGLLECLMPTRSYKLHISADK